MPCFWANYIYVNVNVHATIINQIITYFTILPIFLCFQINQEMRKNIRPIICKKKTEKVHNFDLKIIWHNIF